MANTFSLLRLPSLAQQNVIRKLDCCEKIAISLCSQKMKYLVRRLNFRAKRFRTFIGGVTFRVVSEEVRFYINLKPEDNDPASFKIVQFSWCSPVRSMKDWMDHFKCIYSCDRYALLFEKGSERFNVQYVRSQLEQLKLDELSILNSTIPNKYSIEVLHAFVPVKWLQMEKNPFPTRDAFRAIICRPFHRLLFHWEMEITFLELINFNAVYITCWRCNLTAEELNLFFRLWMHGEYPRLNSMFLQIRNAEFTEKKVLEEMEYEEHEEKGKYWIKTLDGKKAVICFSKPYSDMYADFKVYN